MTQPIQEYLRNKEAREQMPYTYLGWMETGFYSDKDNVLSHEDLARTYPLGEKVTLWDFNQKGDNPDKTHVR